VSSAIVFPRFVIPRKDDAAHSISSHKAYSARLRQPSVGTIDSDPKTNGHYSKRTGRDFNPTWLIVAVVVAAIIILAVVVHW
jgi:hypothetical protein